MDDLSDLLGQGRLADEVADRLRAPGARVWLSGPPGCGKTTVAGAAAERVRRDGKVIRLSGDPAQVGTRFLAAHRALAGTRLNRSMRDALPSMILSPVRYVPYAGAALADWTKFAIALAYRSRPDFLNADQLDILEGFQRLSAGEHVFLIVDDVGWLDVETAQLLATIGRPEVGKAFPFAASLSALFVENVEAAPSSNAEALAALRSVDAFRCEPVQRRDFDRVLHAFGLSRTLDARVVDDLYAISRGHLEIAKQIAKIDEGTDLAAMLARGDANTLMAELLGERLRSLRGAGALLNLLAVAACAGSTFSEAELRCAYMDPDAFQTAMQAARREDFLVDDSDTMRFVHDAVRTAAERLGSAQASSLHAKLADCVQRLRPGDYASRLRHLRLAGRDEQSAQVAFALAMRAVRGAGSGPLGGIPNEVDPIRDVLNDLREGYRLMDAGHYRRALNVVMPRYDGTVSLVQGEVVLLVALNKIKQRTADAYAEAVNLLEFWRERRDEPELWDRLMSVLAVALSNAGETERAGRLYALLCNDLEARSKTDLTTRARLESMNRKADMFLASEVAERHIRRAARWFGPQEDGSPPRDAFEHTACEVNLAGCLMTFGRFQEAAESAKVAMRSVERLGASGQRTVEPYKALNNYAVAAFRADLESPRDLGTALDLVITAGGGPEMRDRALLTCNRAVLALLDGDVDLGAGILGSVWSEVDGGGLDEYYRLYSGANLAVAIALTGDRQRASSLLSEVAPCVEAMPIWVRQAHRRRHAMMAKAVLDPALLTPSAFDAYPAGLRPPDGDQDSWRSIGRGFLMSDIQVWSEA